MLDTVGRLGALALAVVILGACGPGEAADPVDGADSAPIVVRTLDLEAREVVDRVSLPADLNPYRRAVLAAEAPGVVEALRVEEGDDVRAGQVLLEVDRRALEQALAEAEAMALLRAQERERAEKLFERRSITKAQVQDSVANRDVAEARLASARLQLEKSQVKSPWAGRVTARRVELGDYVNPGQAVVELVAVRRLRVRAPVASPDVPFVKVGTPVVVRVDAFPGEAFPAEVVRLAAEVDPRTRTLDVEAELDNSEGRLKPGMPARVEIARRAWKEGLVVPVEALVELGSEQAVFVVENGRAVRRLVTPGPLIDGEILVEKGLEAGDRVVVEGQALIADGQPVTEAPEA